MKMCLSVRSEDVPLRQDKTRQDQQHELDSARQVDGGCLHARTQAGGALTPLRGSFNRVGLRPPKSKYENRGFAWEVYRREKPVFCGVRNIMKEASLKKDRATIPTEREGREG